MTTSIKGPNPSFLELRFGLILINTEIRRHLVKTELSHETQVQPLKLDKLRHITQLIRNKYTLVFDPHHLAPSVGRQHQPW